MTLHPALAFGLAPARTGNLNAKVEGMDAPLPYLGDPLPDPELQHDMGRTGSRHCERCEIELWGRKEHESPHDCVDALKRHVAMADYALTSSMQLVGELLVKFSPPGMLHEVRAVVPAEMQALMGIAISETPNTPEKKTGGHPS